VGSQKLDDSKCSFKCEGDASDKCGGDWALSVYSKDGGIGGTVKRHLDGHLLHQGVQRGSPRLR